MGGKLIMKIVATNVIGSWPSERWLSTLRILMPIHEKWTLDLEFKISEHAKMSNHVGVLFLEKLGKIHDKIFKEDISTLEAYWELELTRTTKTIRNPTNTLGIIVELTQEPSLVEIYFTWTFSQLLLFGCIFQQGPTKGLCLVNGWLRLVCFDFLVTSHS